MLGSVVSYASETLLSVSDNLEFLFRIILSAVIGALVGLERTKRQKEAGIRTHCIIACSAAVFMLLSKYAYLDVPSIIGAKEADPSRIASQVVSGISFLGAGVIFKNGNTIRGLTTAAGMWATAAIGMSIGAGMYWIGISEAIILILIQFIFHRFPVGSDSLISQKISVRIEDGNQLREIFEEFISEHRGQIIQSSMVRKDGELTIVVDVKLPEPITYQMAMSFMTKHKGVHTIDV